jgi:hypothetical protein
MCNLTASVNRLQSGKPPGNVEIMAASTLTTRKGYAIVLRPSGLHEGSTLRKITGCMF